MICSVMQPTFLPWVGYFDLIDSSDKFIFYDDVQFVKQSWQTRNRVKTANGILLINIPTEKSSFKTNINEIKIDNRKPWRKKLLKTLFYTYQKSSSFDEVYTFIESFLSKEYDHLFLFNAELIMSISKKIGSTSKFHYSSELPLSKNIRDKRLVDICKSLDCDKYLSTLGSSSYIEETSPGGEFPKNDIQLLYHNYTPVKYTQNFGSFEAYMSIIDLLFNVGFENALIHIKKGHKKFLNSQEI